MSLAKKRPSRASFSMEEVALCQSLKSTLLLAGFEGASVLVTTEGLLLELHGYAELCGLLPTLQRYGAKLKDSSFKKITVEMGYPDVRRVVAHLQRQIKKQAKRAKKPSTQLSLF